MTSEHYETDLAAARVAIDHRIPQDGYPEDEREKVINDALNNTWTEGKSLDEWVDAAIRRITGRKRFTIQHSEHGTTFAESDSARWIARKWVGMGELTRRDHSLVDSQGDRLMLVERGPDWYRIGYVDGGIIEGAGGEKL